MNFNWEIKENGKISSFGMKKIIYGLVFIPCTMNILGQRHKENEML